MLEVRLAITQSDQCSVEEAVVMAAQQLTQGLCPLVTLEMATGTFSSSKVISLSDIFVLNIYSLYS